MAAAYVAGALSLEDAARVVAERGLAVTQLAGQGGLVAVAAPASQVSAQVARWGGRLVLAAVNVPSSVVVAGDPQALTELREDCQARGIPARRIAGPAGPNGGLAGRLARLDAGGQARLLGGLVRFQVAAVLGHADPAGIDPRGALKISGSTP